MLSILFALGASRLNHKFKRYAHIGNSAICKPADELTNKGYLYNPLGQAPTAANKGDCFIDALPTTAYDADEDMGLTASDVELFIILLVGTTSGTPVPATEVTASAALAAFHSVTFRTLTGSGPSTILSLVQGAAPVTIARATVENGLTITVNSGSGALVFTDLIRLGTGSLVVATTPAGDYSVTNLRIVLTAALPSTTTIDEMLGKTTETVFFSHTTSGIIQVTFIDTVFTSTFGATRGLNLNKVSIRLSGNTVGSTTTTIPRLTTTGEETITFAHTEPTYTLLASQLHIVVTGDVKISNRPITIVTGSVLTCHVINSIAASDALCGKIPTVTLDTDITLHTSTFTSNGVLYVVGTGRMVFANDIAQYPVNFVPPPPLTIFRKDATSAALESILITVGDTGRTELRCFLPAVTNPITGTSRDRISITWGTGTKPTGGNIRIGIAGTHDLGVIDVEQGINAIFLVGSKFSAIITGTNYGIVRTEDIAATTPLVTVDKGELATIAIAGNLCTINPAEDEDDLVLGQTLEFLEGREVKINAAVSSGASPSVMDTKVTITKQLPRMSRLTIAARITITFTARFVYVDNAVVLEGTVATTRAKDGENGKAIQIITGGADEIIIEQIDSTDLDKIEVGTDAIPIELFGIYNIVGGSKRYRFGNFKSSNQAPDGIYYEIKGFYDLGCVTPFIFFPTVGINVSLNLHGAFYFNDNDMLKSTSVTNFLNEYVSEKITLDETSDHYIYFQKSEGGKENITIYSTNAREFVMAKDWEFASFIGLRFILIRDSKPDVIFKSLYLGGTTVLNLEPGLILTATILFVLNNAANSYPDVTEFRVIEKVYGTLASLVSFTDKYITAENKVKNVFACTPGLVTTIISMTNRTLTVGGSNIDLRGFTGRFGFYQDGNEFKWAPSVTATTPGFTGGNRFNIELLEPSHGSFVYRTFDIYLQKTENTKPYAILYQINSLPDDTSFESTAFGYNFGEYLNSTVKFAVDDDTEFTTTVPSFMRVRRINPDNFGGEGSLGGGGLPLWAIIVIVVVAVAIVAAVIIIIICCCCKKKGTANEVGSENV
jgi:hypothetical protein